MRKRKDPKDQTQYCDAPTPQSKRLKNAYDAKRIEFLSKIQGIIKEGRDKIDDYKSPEFKNAQLKCHTLFDQWYKKISDNDNIPTTIELMEKEKNDLLTQKSDALFDHVNSTCNSIIHFLKKQNKAANRSTFKKQEKERLENILQASVERRFNLFDKTSYENFSLLSNETQTVSFTKLLIDFPYDILNCVFQFLPIPSVIGIRLVNKAFAVLLNQSLKTRKETFLFKWYISKYSWFHLMIISMMNDPKVDPHTMKMLNQDFVKHKMVFFAMKFNQESITNFIPKLFKTSFRLFYQSLTKNKYIEKWLNAMKSMCVCETSQYLDYSKNVKTPNENVGTCIYDFCKIQIGSERIHSCNCEPDYNLNGLKPYFNEEPIFRNASFRATFRPHKLEKWILCDESIYFAQGVCDECHVLHDFYKDPQRISKSPICINNKLIVYVHETISPRMLYKAYETMGKYLGISESQCSKITIKQTIEYLSKIYKNSNRPHVIVEFRIIKCDKMLFMLTDLFDMINQKKYIVYSD